MKSRLVILIIATILKKVSPLLRTALDNGIRQLYAKALETDIEEDDLLVEALADLLSVDLEG